MAADPGEDTNSSDEFDETDEDYKILAITEASAEMTHIISKVHEVTGVNIGFNNLH